MKYTTEYSENLPKQFGANTELPSILGKLLGKVPNIVIRPKYKDDIGLLKHELKHVEQFNKYFMYSIRYRFNSIFRYKMELEAYTEQIKEYKYTSILECSWIIDSLANNYSLSIPSNVISKKVLSILNT